MPFLSEQEIELTMVFRDATNALADPTTVTLQVERGDGTLQGTYTYPSPATITHPSTGTYTKRIILPDLTTPEIWTARVEGTGAVQAPAEVQFVVEPAGV